MASYLVARKMHRLLVAAIIALTVIMAFTGLVLKYGLGFSSQDSLMLRSLHNNLSVLFTAVLVLMAASGTYMYFYPMWTRRKQKAQPATDK